MEGNGNNRIAFCSGTAPDSRGTKSILGCRDILITADSAQRYPSWDKILGSFAICLSQEHPTETSVLEEGCQSLGSPHRSFKIFPTALLELDGNFQLSFGMGSDESSGIHILISTLPLWNLELYGSPAWSPESLQGGLWIHSKLLRVCGGEKVFHPTLKPIPVQQSP